VSCCLQWPFSSADVNQPERSRRRIKRKARMAPWKRRMRVTQSQHSAEGYSIVASDRPHELAGAPKYELLGDTEHCGRIEEPAEEQGSRQSVRD
jgi:hypothetical protein